METTDGVEDVVEGAGDIIQHLETLHNNPFLFARTLANFYAVMPPQKGSLLLAYLVLPIALHAPARILLKKNSGRTTLRSFLLERDRIFGLERRVQEWREITNATVQYLTGANILAIKSDLAVTCTRDFDLEDISPIDVATSAKALGRIFAPYDVPTIYRMLGVMKL
ncbi:hypothetical protein P3T24_001749 [Paraburkholderia sp. GAS33]|uniref:three component ABC system middle component n=1 Tax=Paraburkholderia sp. GAS33 TaxID=3035130 RepID=UPI003D2402D8